MNRTLPRQRGAALIVERTALLVIDAQRGICEPEGGMTDTMFATGLEAALPRIAALIDAARASGVEVIYTVIQSLTADGRDRSLDYKLTGFHFPPGTRAAEVVDAVRPEGDEIVLPKTSSSLFNSTAAEYVLRNMGIQSVIVTGFQTDQCIDHTVRDGADRGFEMICATDACAARTPERHRQAIDLFKGYCRIVDADELIAEMELVK